MGGEGEAAGAMSDNITAGRGWPVGEGEQGPLEEDKGDQAQRGHPAPRHAVRDESVSLLAD